jgi:hypothetical protein
MLKNSEQAVGQQRITGSFFHCLNFNYLMSVYLMRTSPVLITSLAQVRRLFSTANLVLFTSKYSRLYTLSTIPTIRTIKLNILLIIEGVYS